MVSQQQKKEGTGGEEGEEGEGKRRGYKGGGVVIKIVCVCVSISFVLLMINLRGYIFIHFIS